MSVACPLNAICVERGIDVRVRNRNYTLGFACTHHWTKLDTRRFAARVVDSKVNHREDQICSQEAFVLDIFDL